MHHFISFLMRFAYAAAFGYILLFHSEDIIIYIPLLLGGLLMLECVGQLLELFLLKVKTHVHNGFFVIPLVVLAYALFLIFQNKLDNISDQATIRELFNPTGGFSNLTLEMQIAGVCLLGFILSEIIISVAFFKPLYQPKKFAEEKAKQQEAQRAIEAERARQAAEQQNHGTHSEKQAESPESQPL